MKRIVCLSTFLLVFFVSFNNLLAQDKKLGPEAGKWYETGENMLKAGNYNGAVENFDKALAIEKDHRIYYMKGVALKKAGKFDEAISAFETALNMDKNYASAYNALAGTYFVKREYQKAVDNYEIVIGLVKDTRTKNAIKKNLAKVYTSYGTEAKKDGKTEKAIEYWGKAVENDNYDAAYLFLAQIYNETGAYDKAIANAENALKYRSTVSKGAPYYYMGLAYKNKGDNDKAIEMFNQAKADPTYKKTVEYELTLLK